MGGPDGKLWFTEARYDANLTLTASAIGAYDPRTGQWSEVNLPSGRQAPFGITRGPDNNIWFSEAVVNTSGAGYSGLGMINPSASPLTITEYAIPLISADTARLPYRLVAGPDGNIWFTDNVTTAIVKFSPTAHTFTPSNAPKVTAFDPIPTSITAGLGNVWFTDAGGAVDLAPWIPSWS